MKETYDGLIRLFYEILWSQTIDESLPIDDIIYDCGYSNYSNESNNNENNNCYYYNTNDNDSYGDNDGYKPRCFSKNCDLCLTDIFNRYYNCSQCNINLCLNCYQRRFACDHPENLTMHQFCHKNSSHLSDLYEEAMEKFNKMFKGEKAIPRQYYT